MAHASLCTDHPGWTETESGRWQRLLSNERGATWVASWNGQALDFMPLAGDGSLPDLTYTHCHRLPLAAPRQLTGALSILGTIVRVTNPSLWDALCVAILQQRQVHPGTGRDLYRRWCTLYGPTREGPHGPLRLPPTPQTLLDLPHGAFDKAKTAFFRASLRSAAAAYQAHGHAWRQLTGTELVTALTSINRVGPSTAAAAAADYLGDFTLYPHHDLTVRTFAHRAAPDADLPVEEEPFARQWTAWAATPGQLRTLTLATLAFGNHVPASTTLAT
ncbi:hypothetical protein [Streptomyces sp. ME19-01-6]|uniref:hypothetical protein n=1 Tax=Streptomyces sp. ME19-01-6 TaxID=3028686 RepID=UPI0029BDFC2A|nr:hypothetical protein [Streptomyces sp. ME19-01-6]MDX3224497.1 hypothetical protein [Streptomyces sp. ME19-01-6]